MPLAERIRRAGPLPFDAFVDAALYDPEHGFFAHGGGAGRAGRDFVTSPEVGPLFGALVARALDGWWDALGRPDPFLVVEAGAGRGRLAREVLRAEPRCAGALRYVLVERSARLREQQRDLLTVEPLEDALGPAISGEPGEAPTPVAGSGPIVTALDELPAIAVEGVILANELLDNLPFEIVERTVDGWAEVRVGLDGDRFVEVLVRAPDELAIEADGMTAGVAVPAGARLPMQRGMQRWLAECGVHLHRGFLVVIDYADTAASMVTRGQAQWLRTYRAHARGTAPLDAPGSQDITCDVVLETLNHAAADAGLDRAWEGTQAEWLAGLGIDDLVENGRARWHERAHVGDLEAIAARSRVTEADALTDPTGLGAHRVAVFRC